MEARRDGRSAGELELKLGIEEFLVVKLGIGEQHVEFVALLLTVFGIFAAGFRGLFLALFDPLSLLRFEANFVSAPVGSEL